MAGRSWANVPKPPKPSQQTSANRPQWRMIVLASVFVVIACLGSYAYFASEEQHEATTTAITVDAVAVAP